MINVVAPSKPLAGEIVYAHRRHGMASTGTIAAEKIAFARGREASLGIT